MSLPITFTQDESIDQAFIKLSASVTDLIKNANFASLQRACIEKAKTPKMLLKSNEIVPVIKEARSFQALCSMLADTTYWNFSGYQNDGGHGNCLYDTSCSRDN